MMNKVQAKTLVFTKQPFIEEEGHCRIAQWQFNALSQSEISKMAATQIFLGRYYDSNQKPIKGGLLDARLGPANRHCDDCETCGAKLSDCPGHFGYLVLAVPVFNVGYLSTVVDVLKCICKSCSRIILDDKSHSRFLNIVRDPKKDKSVTMKLIVKKCTSMTSNNRSVKCPKCGYMNGSVKRAQGMLGIVHGAVDDFKSVIPVMKDSKASINLQPHMLNPVKVFSLFKRMLDEDCELLNLKSRPENLIMTTIAVPPIAIRPSVLVDGSQSNENDITERLKRIIQANANVQLDLSEGSTIRFLSNWDLLQAEVAQYINSDVRGIPFHMQTTTKPLNGLVQRLKGKTGRFRGNLCGKRVEYTGRTVISPDPNLKITEVGIPIKMAQILSYPERVSHHNIEKLRQCVVNGPYKYPGALRLKRPDGSEWTLMVEKRKFHADNLNYGDIVHRHLEDGDIVLFNRQPSLHRMSIMCHRARIMPWRTLRFNESVCNPYNADFDGDEMNMHVPQTEEARTEAVMLMGVQNNLCTPKNGEILVASTQDFLTSSFLITRKDTFYDRASFSLMCSYMGDGIDPVDLPTPAVIKPIELWTGKQLYSVLVRPNSNVRVYLNLTVREKSYSNTKTEDGRETEAMCPNDGFVYFRNSELLSGQLGKGTLGNGNKDGLFSVLLRDYKAHAAASCMNRVTKLSARWIGNHGFSIGISNVQPSDILYGEKEKIIKKGYDKCDDQIKLYHEGQPRLALGCDATQSFESGITAVLNVRNQTGKVKNADTGYMSRRLSKVLEDLSVQYDKTVRAANGGIVQFCYEDDGMNPARMEGKSGAPLDLYRLFFKAKATCPAGENESLSPDEVSEIVRSRLSKQDMTPDGGCSMGFKSSIEQFLDEYVKALRKTQETFLLNQSPGWKVKSATLEKIVQNISGVTSRQLKIFLDTCISRYRSKKVDAGPAVGVIGAQSIGKPGTQMALKTFPFAGVANVTLGVPRIKEIINGAKNIHTPIITTVLGCDNNPMIARMVAGRIEKTNLGQVAECIEIVMSPRAAYIAIRLDMAVIQDAHLSIDANVVKESILETSRIKLKQEHIRVPDIQTVEVHSHEKDRRKLHFHLYHLKSMLPNVIVRGIKTIERVVIDEEKVKKDKKNIEVKCGEKKKYKLFAEGARRIGNYGFSIGISDVQPSDILYGEKEKIIKKGYDKCDDQIKLYNEGQLRLAPGFDAAQSLESGITAVLNDIRDQTGESSWGILQAEVEVIDDSTIGSRWKTHINSDVHGVPYQMQANTKPLNGKCVKHTGRTVISPDSDLKITEGIRITALEDQYNNDVLQDLFDSSGTTNIAFTNGISIFVVVDSRRTWNDTEEIAENEHYKFLDFSDTVPNVVGTQCGNAGICKLIPKHVREMVDKTGQTSIEHIARFIFDFLKTKSEDKDATAQRKEQVLRTSTIIATIDSKGPTIFLINCRNDGPLKIESGQYACCGSGKNYARSVLESRISLLDRFLLVDTTQMLFNSA